MISVYKGFDLFVLFFATFPLFYSIPIPPLMERYVIGRNKGWDFLFALPMLFLFIGGIYMLIDGRPSDFYLALSLTIIPGSILAWVIYKLIQNKPYIVLDHEGIYLYHLGRVIPWKDIGQVKLEEYEDDRERTSRTRHYFVVMEITERKSDGHAGVDHKLFTDFTDHSNDDLINMAKKYYQHYQS